MELKLDGIFEKWGAEIAIYKNKQYETPVFCFQTNFEDKSSLFQWILMLHHFSKCIIYAELSYKNISWYCCLRMLDNFKEIIQQKKYNK